MIGKDVMTISTQDVQYIIKVFLLNPKISGVQTALKSFATCLQKIVKGYDSFLNKKCPYIMGLHAAPKINDKTFHFHVEFYPPLRSNDKPKILAGSESMAGVFIMDVLPEDSAKTLREHMQ